MPDARVLVYEYASRWYDDPVRTDLRECAAQFLRTLLRNRRHAHSKKLCATRVGQLDIFDALILMMHSERDR